MTMHWPVVIDGVEYDIENCPLRCREALFPGSEREDDMCGVDRGMCIGNCCPNTKVMPCELCGSPMDYSEIRGVTYKYNDGETPYYIETTFDYACEECRNKLFQFAMEHYEWESMSGFWAEYGREIYYIKDRVDDPSDEYDVERMLERLVEK